MPKNNKQVSISPDKLISMYESLVNNPVCFQPGYLHSLRSSLRHLYMQGESQDISDFMFLFGGDNNKNQLTVQNGVARINISGPIYNDDPEDWEVRNGYIASYKAIRQDFQTCKDNEDVQVALFDIESPGGIGGPLMDLMEEIYEARDVLPSIAFIENYGFSAAQGIAAACSEVWVTRGARAGSVGSIIVHEDVSEMLKMDGISVETFTYGKKKDQGASFKPLSDDAREEYNDTVTKHGKEFTELTAKFLGKEFKAIKALEAGTFSGQEAIDVGLAHRVVQGHTVQAEIESKFSLTSKKKGKGVESKMDINQLKTENPEAYTLLLAEAKTEAEASIKKPGEEAAPSAELSGKIDGLTAIVEEQGKVIVTQAAQLKEHDKLELIRKAKAIESSALGIKTAALSHKDCTIPESLHSKVTVDHSKFLKEDGELDTESYTKAVDEEVKDWQTKYAKEETPGVMGMGSGGDDGGVADETSEADTLASINRLRKAGGLKPIEA